MKGAPRKDSKDGGDKGGNVDRKKSEDKGSGKSAGEDVAAQSSGRLGTSHWCLCHTPIAKELLILP